MTSPIVELVIRPEPLVRLELAWSLGCLLLILLPWACDLRLVAAVLIDGVILLGWRSGRRSLRGSRQPGYCLRVEGRRLSFTDGDGPAEAQCLPGSRVGTGWVLLRLRRDRRRFHWWIPAAALDESSFRRLRVLVRCSATDEARGC